jgi:hypothetical protein
MSRWLGLDVPMNFMASMLFWFCSYLGLPVDVLIALLVFWSHLIIVQAPMITCQM